MIFAVLLTSFMWISESLAAPQPSTLKLNSPLTFDLPVDYNREVKAWIKHFQGPGRQVFTTWLKRSGRFMPAIQRTLAKEGLPLDLAYVAMIESGFSPTAVSHANAVGPWQFIADTGQRYGLQINWWLDERRDFDKSTKAAAKYLRYLHRLFGSWYLAAAGYNTGESRIARLVQKHGTKNFWTIAKQGGFHYETKDYIPKLIAAMLIAKAPSLYGFRGISLLKPVESELFRVAGGTHLHVIADQLDVPRDTMKDLNPELLKGFVPPTVSSHLIRIPKGTSAKLSAIIRSQLISTN
ncbi:MAG TPA: lytic transglycosylase domain-containing protein [Bdellovibrionales bacterium]|nr:lytic transglycosylase domain-containing protein [Bdellovibrionales bacterium]